MAYRQLTIPITKGRDEGSADFAIDSQTQDLIAATNVVFTKKGAIRGRPGTVSLDGQVIAYDKTPVSGAGLATPLGVYQPQALHVDDTGHVLLQTFGRLFRRVGTQWLDVGAMYSVRRTTYAVTASFTVQDYFGQVTNDPMVCAMDMGNNIASKMLGGGNAHNGTNLGFGFGVYDANGQVVGPVKTTGGTTGPSTNVDGRGASAANNAIFWIDASSLNKVGCTIYSGTYPNAIGVDLATDASTVAYNTFNYQRIWAAWDGTNYYVAYISGSAGADTITIRKVSTAGALVGSPLVYTTATTVLSMCLAVDSVTGKGMLAYTTVAASQVRSQVFTLSTMVDLAISVTRAPVNTTDTVGMVCAIFAGQGYYAWHGHPVGNGATSTLEIATRSLTAASDAVGPVYGAGTPTALGAVGGVLADGSAATLAWMTLFAPVAIAGRLLMGIATSIRSSSSSSSVVSPCTWAVIDVTDITNVNFPYVVAAGDNEDSMAPSRAAAATATNGGLLFAVGQGAQFSAFGLTQANITPILLVPQAAPSCVAGPHLVLGGVLPTIYDGYATYEAGWVGRPSLTVLFTSIGNYVAGSYSFQAVWVYTDALGQVSRSLPSRLVTATSPGAAQAKVFVSAPLLSNKFTTLSATNQASLVCEIYSTNTNPAATSPLTLAGKVTIDSRASAANSVVTLQLGTPIPGAPQIYTTGGILADERPGGADRGVVVVDNRIWAADEYTLYASHLRTINVAPAWNNEEFFIDVPESFGRVQGLAAIDDKVVAVCENGVLAVNGPGLDDAGGGAGWSAPERVATIGGAGPARAVCSHPGGGAFVGVDGIVYGISRALAVEPIGQPVRDSTEASADLVYVPSGRNVGQDVTSNPLLVYGTTNLKVMDLTNGQWAIWTGLTATSLAGVSTGLLALTASTPFVVQYSATGGLDLGVAFSMSIRLRPQETTEEGAMTGWGRVRTVNPVFTTLGAHTISVQVYADEEQVKIMDKSFSVPA